MSTPASCETTILLTVADRIADDLEERAAEVVAKIAAGRAPRFATTVEATP